MSQQSPSLSETQGQQQEFDPKQKKPQKKSKSKKTNQSLSKSKSTKESQKAQEKVEQKGKKRGGKKKQEKSKAQEEKPVQKQKKEPAQQKRKPKSKKQPQSNLQSKSKVLEYMQKQNRPYNLLNIFDNLHGKIKKAELQIILNQLAQSGQLSCKQFGKNKVYFLNQDKFDLNMKQVEQVGSEYTRLKQQVQVLREENKKLNDQYRKLVSKKTMQELQDDTLQLVATIGQLKKKREYLLNQGKDNKMDQAQVIKIEKQGEKLQKQLRKRKKLLKECLDSWCQMTQKKLPQMIEIMGIEMA